MDWHDAPGHAEFRKEVRDLLIFRLPGRYREFAKRGSPPERLWEFDRKSEDPEARLAAREWHAALGERGWVAPHWPKEYGGAGLTIAEQFILNEELARVRAPTVGGSGVSLLGPTLIVHGTEAQRSKYLPSILGGEVTWAQGYSEPGAGSDLASLQTRATREGDEFVINGQKIWTSAAHSSDSMFLLVRMDREAPKHKGISFLLIDDIRAQGISIGALIDMGGRHYFNEVFFDGVRVPVENLVGELNGGWSVAMTLLDFERSNVAGAVAAGRSLRRLNDGQAGAADPGTHRRTATTRAAIAQRFIEAEVMYQFSASIGMRRDRQDLLNGQASMAKLFSSELTQRVANTTLEATGLQGLLTEGSEFANAYLAAVSGTIRGGTSEMQRNVIATRRLGLPR
ncbi:MAG: acyl-CoA dehydrogenase family protein [Dehalococcoidia bacterium]